MEKIKFELGSIDKSIEVSTDCKQNIEFSKEQLERLQEIDDAVYNLCKVMTNNEDLVKDTCMINDIAEFVANYLAKREWSIYFPAMINKDGSKDILDFYNEYHKAL